MSPDEKDELKTLLAVSKKRAVNFGLCVAGKPEETVMYLHRKKSPEILQRLAKKAAGTPKVASGTLESKGKEISLSCLDDPPAGAAKRLRQFFQVAISMKAKIRFLDPNGDIQEEDGEVEESDLGADDAADGELSRRVDAALAKLEPRIAAARKANAAADKPLGLLLASLRKAGEENNAREVKKRLGQLTGLLDKLGGGAGETSIVKLGKARIEWRDLHAKAFQDLGRLKSKIQEDYADMPEAASAVDAAFAKLDKSFGALTEELGSRLDALLNAEGDARKAQVPGVKETVGKFKKHVESDPILAALDDNDILPDLKIAGQMNQKLDEIARAIGA